LAEKEVILDTVVQMRAEGVESVNTALKKVDRSANTLADSVERAEREFQQMSIAARNAANNANQSAVGVTQSLDRMLDPASKLMGLASKGTAVVLAVTAAATGGFSVGQKIGEMLFGVTENTDKFIASLERLKEVTVSSTGPETLRDIGNSIHFLSQKILDVEQSPVQSALTHLGLDGPSLTELRAELERLQGLQSDILNRNAEAARPKPAGPDAGLAEIQSEARAWDEEQQRRFRATEAGARRAAEVDLGYLRSQQEKAATNEERARIESLMRYVEVRLAAELEVIKKAADAEESSRTASIEREERARDEANKRNHQREMDRIEDQKRARIQANIEVYNEWQQLNQTQVGNFGVLNGSGSVVEAIERMSDRVSRRAGRV
jgi:hypothetical protein